MQNPDRGTSMCHSQARTGSPPGRAFRRPWPRTILVHGPKEPPERRLQGRIARPLTGQSFRRHEIWSTSAYKKGCRQKIGPVKGPFNRPIARTWSTLQFAIGPVHDPTKPAGIRSPACSEPLAVNYWRRFWITIGQHESRMGAFRGYLGEAPTYVTELVG